MIDRIYKVIAYKKIIFRCNNCDRIKEHWEDCNDCVSEFSFSTRECIENIPIMIGDVLARYEKLPHAEVYTDNSLVIIKAWKDKRKPLQDQPIECIEYINSLLIS